MRVFNDFRFKAALRIIFIGCLMALVAYLYLLYGLSLAPILVSVIIIILFFELARFVSRTNQKLTRFLESIRYSDFISGFAYDNSLGRSFKNLNKAFNEVLEAFRKARSEKEEHWQYLNTVVQQVRTGLLSFDADGNVQLLNANARRYMGVLTLSNMSEVLDKNPKLYKAIFDATPSSVTLYKGPRNLHLTILSTEMRIRGNVIRLVTMQNIQPELQHQELEAWQNLTRVLRHEIMNSITPITSLTSTLKEVLNHDLAPTTDGFQLKRESADDLKEGLGTIESRSKGLIKFIDAYREYTSLPQPTITMIRLKDLIDKISQLMSSEMRKNNDIKFIVLCPSEYLTIQADFNMIEQVIINLVKNAMESVSEVPNPLIEVTGTYDDISTLIEISDNGVGILMESLEQIFVPFYTTKKGGSGIGLSLSRQIMQMHQGTISVESEPGVRTSFKLRF